MKLESESDKCVGAKSTVFADVSRRVAKRVMGGKFTIDWHNLGYSIFSMQRKRGGKDVLVRVMKAYEKYFWVFDHHLTVTEKMKDFLIREWSVDARQISV